MPRETQPKRIEIYQTANGKRPFEDWLKRLDKKVQVRIDSKIMNQLAAGGALTKPLDEDLFEVKLDFGPGYRVYCGDHTDALIIVLCGGDKSTQSKDIEKARDYWYDFKQRAV